MPTKEKMIQYARDRGLSLFIFEENYSSLINAFEKMNINDTQWPLSNGAVMEFNYNVISDLNDLLRNICNFVSSAFSLIEHTRIIINNYPSKEFFDAYQKKIDSEIKNEFLLEFVKDFRNCIVHKGIPPYSLHRTSVYYESDNRLVGEANKLYFECSSLIDFYSWKKPSENYIKTHHEKIDFQLVIEEYFQKISLFNRWIDEQIEIP